MALNKVLMAGRLTSTPELKQTQSGVYITKFILAINEGKDKTSFFNCVAWKQTAEFVSRYFTKGDGICIDGHLVKTSYEKDGTKHTAYEVVADSVGFAEGRGKQDGGTVSYTTNKSRS